MYCSGDLFDFDTYLDNHATNGEGKLSDANHRCPSQPVSSQREFSADDRREHLQILDKSRGVISKLGGDQPPHRSAEMPSDLLCNKRTAKLENLSRCSPDLVASCYNSEVRLNAFLTMLHCLDNADGDGISLISTSDHHTWPEKEL